MVQCRTECEAEMKSKWYSAAQCRTEINMVQEMKSNWYSAVQCHTVFVVQCNTAPYSAAQCRAMQSVLPLRISRSIRSHPKFPQSRTLNQMQMIFVLFFVDTI